MTILLSLSDGSLGAIFAEYLDSQGIRTKIVRRQKDVMPYIRTEEPDLVLLDSGTDMRPTLTLLTQLRQYSPTLPILMLGESNERDVILRTYSMGVDEYIVKPYSMEVIIAKMRAWTRRDILQREHGEKVFDLGELHFDSVHQTLGERHLSGKECEILLYLCRHQEQMIDRHTLLRAIWQRDDYFVSRSLSVFIHHLRTYIRPYGYDILSHRSCGYKLVKEL